MRTIIATVATLLALSGVPAGAQEQTFASLEQLASRLQQEKVPSALAQNLHLSSCGQKRSCSDFNQTIRVLHPRLDANSETAVLQVENLQDADLVVFVRNREGSWTWVDSLPLEFRYEPLKLEFRSLVKAPVEEIVIHNNTATSGTGVYQGHFLIVKLARERLHVVFSATEKEDATPYGGIPWSAVSTFRLEPGARDTPGLRHPASVTQTTKYEIGARKRTVLRKSSWDDRFGMFLPDIGSEIR